MYLEWRSTSGGKEEGNTSSGTSPLNPFSNHSCLFFCPLQLIRVSSSPEASPHERRKILGLCYEGQEDCLKICDGVCDLDSSGKWNLGWFHNYIALKIFSRLLMLYSFCETRADVLHLWSQDRKICEGYNELGISWIIMILYLEDDVISVEGIHKAKGGDDVNV